MTDILESLDTIWKDNTRNVGYAMTSVQMVNWGTFTRAQRIPMDPVGHMFTGGSGAGKSTILDALATILFRQKDLDLNAAAARNSKKDDSRTVLGYVRGEYAEVEAADGGDTVGAHRPGAAWAAVSAEFTHSNRPPVTLIRTFRASESTARTSDMQTSFIFWEGVFDLIDTEPYVRDGFDTNGMNALLPGVFIYRDYQPYQEKLRRAFGIRSEKGLRLLLKTLSMKDVGSLDELMQNFMLDDPETGKYADTAVAGFADLEAAHTAAVNAESQQRILAPLREHVQTIADGRARCIVLDEDAAAVERIHLERLVERLTGEQRSTEERKQRASIALTAADKKKKEVDGRLMELRSDRDRSGGTELDTLEARIYSTRTTLGFTEQRRAGFAEVLSRLGYLMPRTAQELSSMSLTANNALGTVEADKEDVSRTLYAASDAVSTARSKKEAAAKALASLSTRSTSVDEDDDEMRNRIASACNLTPDVMPFIAELIEVRDDQQEWRPALEKVLHSSAVTFLVPTANYRQVAQWVNENNLGRLVNFQPVDAYDGRTVPEPGPTSIINKLVFADHPFADIARRRLLIRHNLEAVDDITEATRSAVTIAGLSRTGDRHHAKDDRAKSNSPSDWIIGFTNSERRAALEETKRRSEAEESRLTKDRNSAQAAAEAVQTRAADLIIVIEQDWEDIDVESAQAELVGRVTAMKTLREAKGDLDAIENHIEETVKEQELCNQRRDAALTSSDRATDRTRILTENLTAEKERLSKIPHAPADVNARVRARFAAVATDASDMNEVRESIQNDRNSSSSAMSGAEKRVARIQGTFAAEWGGDFTELVVDSDAVGEHVAVLDRIESDDIPRHRKKFREMMHEGPTKALVDLNTQMDEEAKAIRAALSPINQVLLTTQFNRGTYLQIHTRDITPAPAHEFRRQLREYQSERLSGRGEEETLFRLLSAIISKLVVTAENRWWRDEVLDVRKHVKFYGESSGEGRQTQRHTSASKGSGGERSKFEAFTLAAALKHQMASGTDHPSFAPVIIDEAYSNADAAFTAQALDAFTAFGFQMILATPNKMLNVFVDYVGAGTIVTKNDKTYESDTIHVPLGKLRRFGQGSL
jgi:uncharacterized protein YPO0396